MSDADIIKALKLCTSEHLGCEDGCPYVEKGGLLKDALDLINRQKEKIDRMEEEIVQMWMRL